MLVMVRRGRVSLLSVGMEGKVGGEVVMVGDVISVWPGFIGSGRLSLLIVVESDAVPRSKAAKKKRGGGGF